MWKTLIALPLLLLCGCQAKETPMELPTDASTVLVRDSLAILRGVYPPARTRLHLVRDADDAFGAELLEAMRESGYAVSEYVALSEKAIQTAPLHSLAFDYRLIESSQERQVRLALIVGNESLSRQYAVQEAADGLALVPTSYWVRKQSGVLQDSDSNR